MSCYLCTGEDLVDGNLGGEDKVLMDGLLQIAGIEMDIPNEMVLICRQCREDLNYFQRFINRLWETRNRVLPSNKDAAATIADTDLTEDFTDQSPHKGNITLLSRAKRIRRRPKRFEEASNQLSTENGEKGKYIKKVREKYSKLNSLPKMAYVKTIRDSTTIVGDLVETDSRGKHTRLRLLCRQCPEEQAAFCIERDFRNHLLRHSKTAQGQDILLYYCTICNYKFDDHSSARRHFKKTHSDERNIKCSICAATFKHQFNMNYHMASCHLNIKSHVCPYCQKSFVLKYELKVHLRIHSGERPYRCDACGKAFAHNSNLICHRRRLHDDDRSKETSSSRKQNACQQISGTHRNATPDRVTLKTNSKDEAALNDENNVELERSLKLDTFTNETKGNPGDKTKEEYSLSIDKEKIRLSLNALPQDLSKPKENTIKLSEEVKAAIEQINLDYTLRKTTTTSTTTARKKNVSPMVVESEENNTKNGIINATTMETMDIVSTKDDSINESSSTIIPHRNLNEDLNRKIKIISSQRPQKETHFTITNIVAHNKPELQQDRVTIVASCNDEGNGDDFAFIQTLDKDEEYDKPTPRKSHTNIGNNITLRKTPFKYKVLPYTLLKHKSPNTNKYPNTNKSPNTNESPTTNVNASSNSSALASSLHVNPNSSAQQSLLKAVIPAKRSQHLIRKVDILPKLNINELKITTISNEPATSVPTNMSIIPNEYKFQCSKCWKYFKQKSALNKHMRTHTGEKPYKCNSCPKSYADASNFKKHKLLHTKAADALNITRPKPSISPALSIAVSDPDPDGIEVMQTIERFELSSNDEEDDMWQDALEHSLLDEEIRENIKQNLMAISNAIMPTRTDGHLERNSSLLPMNIFSIEHPD